MTPKVQKVTIAGREFLLDRTGAEPGPGVTLNSATRDSGNTPTTQLRPALVVGKHASNGTFYEADHASVKKSAPATVTSTIDIGAGAASKTFKFLTDPAGPEFTVTLGAGDNTTALVVTALNANAQFAAALFAKASASTLVIESRNVSSEGYFKITNGTLNDQGGADQDTFVDNVEYRGTDGEYYVLDEPFVDMLDDAGTASDQVAGKTIRRGNFDTSQLLKLSEDAKKVFLRRGSYFD